MDHLLALTVFCFVSSVTPGPNNALLWASGLQFGVRATIAHIAGTSVGIAVMAAAVAVGLGTLVATVPGVALAVKLVGSVYLTFLAWRMAAGVRAAQGEAAQPLRLGQAVAFQCLNPKAWLFCLAAMGTFRPIDLPVVAGSAVVVAVMAVVVLPTAAIWAAGGTLVNRVVSGPRAHRAVSLVLAGLLMVSVLSLWW